MEQEENVLKLEQNKNPKNDNANIFMKSEDRQNFNTVIVPPPISVINNNNDILSRLINTKMIRIRLHTKNACVTGCKKPFYEINTISRIDDINRQNENEIPLFVIEENTGCDFCPFCKSPGRKFDVFVAGTQNLISVIETRQDITRIEDCCDCCGERYDVYPPIYTYKCLNPNDIGFVKRYDSRSIYRTFEHFGFAYYKLGEPYIPYEKTISEKCCICCQCVSHSICFCCESCCSCSCKDCCCCSCNKDGCKCECNSKKNSGCCDCCKGCCCCGGCGGSSKGSCCGNDVDIEYDKRSYIDIFTMDNRSVGKYVKFYDVTGCSCNRKETLFYEIYFPSDANDSLRLAILGQMIFFIHFNYNYYGILPGSRDNLNQFIM